MKLLVSGVRTVSGVGTGKYANNQPVSGAVFLLSVTAAATVAGDTLDVYVQHSVDAGVTWDDFIHFTQVLGNGGAKKFQAYWQGELLAATPLRAPTDATAAVGVVQGPVANFWREKHVIVGTGSFTFEVSYSPTLLT